MTGLLIALIWAAAVTAILRFLHCANPERSGSIRPMSADDRLFWQHRERASAERAERLQRKGRV